MATWNLVNADDPIKARSAINAPSQDSVPFAVAVLDADDLPSAIAAIQAAGKGILYVPFGTTLTPTTETVLPDEVSGLIVDGEVVISADVVGFSRTGEVLGESADLLTANVDAGDREVSITSTAAYTEGDWVLVFSSDVLTDSTVKLGYMRQISYIPDETTLRFDATVPRAMTTANTVRVRRIQLAEPLMVGGRGTIRYDDPVSYFSAMFEFTAMPQPHFEPSLNLRDGGGACIRLNHVIGGAGALTPNIDNFLDHNQYEGHFGYGVLLSGACRDNVIEGRISRCRHAVTTGSGPDSTTEMPLSFYGEPENFTLAPTTYKCTDKCLDSHRAGFGARYILRDTGSAGAQVRCDGVSVEGHIHQLGDGDTSAVKVGSGVPIDGSIDYPPTVGHIHVTGSVNETSPFLRALSDVTLAVWPTLDDFAGPFKTGDGVVSYPPNGVRRVDIDPFSTPDDEDGTWVLSGDSSSIHGGYRESSAQNDAVAWDVGLDAGTWAVDILCRIGTDKGIASVLIDDVEVDAVDMYAGSGTRNTLLTAEGAGGVLTWNGTHEVKILMDAKNASSSGYLAMIQQVTLRRTA